MLKLALSIGLLPEFPRKRFTQKETEDIVKILSLCRSIRNQILDLPRAEALAVLEDLYNSSIEDND